MGLWDAIEALVAEGTTLVLTTQYLDEADRLADRIAVIDRGLVIAEGTSNELKARVGGDRLEIHLCDGHRGEEAVAAVAPIASDRPFIEDGFVRVPVAERRGTIAEAVRRLDEAGIAIDDISVSSPTLDDVFLTLTGRATEEDAE
jgi:ABC-2 type transport system ATP-binding protein